MCWFFSSTPLKSLWNLWNMTGRQLVARPPLVSNRPGRLSTALLHQGRVRPPDLEIPTFHGENPGENHGENLVSCSLKKWDWLILIQDRVVTMACWSSTRIAPELGSRGGQRSSSTSQFDSSTKWFSWLTPPKIQYLGILFWNVFSSPINLPPKYATEVDWSTYGRPPVIRPSENRMNARVGLMVVFGLQLGA